MVDSIFPNWYAGSGILTVLQSNTIGTVPWSGRISSQSLDIAYNARSGNKFIAPIVYNFLDDETHQVTDVAKFANFVVSTYLEKWNHLWEIYTTQYSPLDTYRVTETGTSTKELARSDDSTRTPNLSEQLVHGRLTTESGAPSTIDTNQVYGFNSSDGVDQSKSTTAQTIDTKTANSGTDTTLTTGSDTTESTGTEDESKSYTTTKTGNMYRSPSELLSLDRDFWITEYFEYIFNDIDRAIALPNYSLSPVNQTVY